MTIRSVFAGVAGVLAALVLAAPAHAGPVSNSPFFELFGSGRVPSESTSSKLTRRGNHIDVEIQSDGLDPNTAYTVWAVIFNFSEFCTSTPCGPENLPVIPGHDPRIQASAQRVTGGYSDADGNVNIIGRLYTPTNGIQPAETLLGPGLLRPFRAEIHFVLRGHGQPANPFNAIQYYDSGCAETGACGDHQVSPHLPLNP